MPKADPATLTPEEIELQAAQYAAWREAVASRLSDAGRWSESVNFRDCGKLFGNFQVLVCEADVTHQARALPFTCHLRYCPECERRNQARQVAKYTPILKDIAEQTDRPGWSLKKIELTTKYSLLTSNAAELYADAWEQFERWQQITFKHLLHHELTPAEIRRDRVDLKQHGVGSLVSAEFGETGLLLHFHILGYMPYLDKHKSSEFWLQATGGEASITYIRQIDYHDVEDAVREQVKYVTKFNQLSPALVLKLADVLDGQHRLRTYGVFRSVKKTEPEPCTCPSCKQKISIIRVREYFERIIVRNVEPDPAIYAAAAEIFLDLKRGNKVGEVFGQKLARSDPDDLPAQADLPGFDDAAPTKKPFQYH